MNIIHTCTPRTGSITVSKVITGLPLDETYFHIVVTGQGAEPTIVDGYVSQQETITFDNLPFDTYMITEEEVEGYTLIGIDSDTVVLSRSNRNAEVVVTNELVVAELALELTFDDIVNVPVADASDVADWNTFFDLPTNGTEFSSVELAGNVIKLYGGSGITVKEDLFYFEFSYDWTDPENPITIDNNHILTIKDFACCIVTLSNHSISGSTTLTELYLPACTTTLNTDTPGYYSGAVSGNIILQKINMPVCSNIAKYTFTGSTLLNDLTLSWSDITTINDGVFKFCPNILSFSFPNATSVGNEAFAECTNTTIFNIPKAISIGEFAFVACSSALGFYFPLATLVGEVAFDACVSAIEFNIPLLAIINIATFRSTSSCLSFDFPLATEIHDMAFSASGATSFNLPNVTRTYGDGGSYPRTIFGNNVLSNLTLPSLLTLGTGSMAYCTNLSSVNLPLTTTIESEAFMGCSILNTISIPSCTNLGGSVGVNFVFLNITGQTITLTIPSALMTCNGGSPDGDIQYLVANNTVTIVTV